MDFQPAEKKKKKKNNKAIDLFLQAFPPLSLLLFTRKPFGTGMDHYIITTADWWSF